MRETGKTFRAVLTALVAASEGKTVALVVRDDRMAEWTFGFVLRVAHCVVEKIVSHPARLVAFPSGGRLYVCSIQRYHEREHWAGTNRPEPVYDVDL